MLMVPGEAARDNDHCGATLRVTEWRGAGGLRSFHGCRGV